MNTLVGGSGNYIIREKRRFSYFAGNNYLGLSQNPAIIKETILALKKYGINFAASRQTTGTADIHLKLEKLLAEFKGSGEAMVFASGYLGNSLLLNVLKENYNAVFADSMAHPSILDGIPKEISAIRFYNHCDAGHLESLLKKSKKRPLLITDGIFALTGEIAPLDQIYNLAEKYNAILIVDDAHATGILGKNGKGTPEHFNLNNKRNLYQSETMSKALGSYGGFICSDKKIIRDIRTKSRFYGASTALPPPIVAAGYASVRYLQQHPELRQRLKENIHLIKNGLRKLDFPVIDEETPIVPLFFNSKKAAQYLSQYLEKNYIIAPYIEYPSKMEKHTVRMTVSAIHTKEQIENLLWLLKKWKDLNATKNGQTVV
jgi:7-keto-8-aminopelargonate synthetase-like enzyme